MKIIYVSAGILVKNGNLVFLAQRPDDKTMSGLWEFPGGKIENDETPEAALVRELDEEIGITVNPCDLTPFTFVTQQGAKFFLVMFLFLCTKWKGTPHGKENQNIGWVSPEELNQFSFPKADEPILPLLKKYLKETS